MAVAKTEEIIKEIYKSKTISEKEINLLKNRKNNGKDVGLDYMLDDDISLTKSQTAKGLKYLMNQWKTPKGKERVNNPFGYREEEVLENFSQFEFVGFHDAGNFWTRFYVPVYSVIAKNGSHFDYAIYGGKVQILG